MGSTIFAGGQCRGQRVEGARCYQVWRWRSRNGDEAHVQVSCAS